MGKFVNALKTSEKVAKTEHVCVTGLSNIMFSPHFPILIQRWADKCKIDYVFTADAEMHKNEGP